MSAPRLEIDLDKIQHNTRTLVDRLAFRGIAVSGVTKASLGSPEIALALLRGGVRGLADSRIENIEAMRLARVPGAMTLIRSPMISQVDRVVAHADVSFNTELEVLSKLSSAAISAGKTHGVVLMVELGDLREGILPGDVHDMVGEALRHPGLTLEGIGTNLACRSGVVPSSENMAELSGLADSIEATFGIKLRVVSGGNSANLSWVLGAASVGRVNELRLGEALLLGREPLTRQPIEGLYADAFTLYAEVIEAKQKPSLPWGEIAQSAFGELPPAIDRGPVWQTIFAVGRQDTDPEGLQPPKGMEVLAASSDHLIVAQGSSSLPAGAEAAFQVNYSALVRAMTSNFVAKVLAAPSIQAR
ncbi:MAG: alanine/ornithine racemase family PLP-dependent enzyme [Planctomycetota bacterium]|nr:alanine/ornithine racemase family PLP-dependent enzyme [Planctomycetota bacterium]